MSVEAAQPTPAPSPAVRQPLVKLENLVKYFPVTQGVLFQRRVGDVHAVDGVDLEIYPGETVGLVGSRAAASPRWPGS